MLVIEMVVLGNVGRMVMDGDDTHHAHTYRTVRETQTDTQTDRQKDNEKTQGPAHTDMGKRVRIRSSVCVSFKVLGIFVYHLM